MASSKLSYRGWAVRSLPPRARRAAGSRIAGSSRTSALDRARTSAPRARRRGVRRTSARARAAPSPTARRRAEVVGDAPRGLVGRSAVPEQVGREHAMRLGERRSARRAKWPPQAVTPWRQASTGAPSSPQVRTRSDRAAATLPSFMPEAASVSGGPIAVAPARECATPVRGSVRAPQGGCGGPWSAPYPETSDGRAPPSCRLRGGVAPTAPASPVAG